MKKIDKLILENNLNENKNLENNQNNFLKSAFSLAINQAVNYGLKKLLPDFVENQVIEIKDVILNNGIKDGINIAIEKTIDLGKSAIGILTGNFEKISQVETAVKKGGLIDFTSELIDTSIKNAREKDIINSKIGSILKNGKNIIQESLDTNIGELLKEQKNTLKKVENHIEKWQEYREQKNFINMDIEYNKIIKDVSKIIPLEETLARVAEVENIHNLIKNNGQKFQLTNEQLYLAQKLV